MKKVYLILVLFIFTFTNYAQYGGLLVGVEFSKPLFSDKSYPRPGLMLGFLYHGVIIRKEIDYQIEFTINHYLDFVTYKYPYYENQVIQDYMIEDRENYYTSGELTALFEFPELFAESYPNFYLGFSLGYTGEKHEHKIVHFVPQISPMVMDSEPSPLPVPLSMNIGLSYTFKNYTFDLRYKLTQVLLDEEDFMQNVYFIFRLHLRD